jgi:hypothetical protein
VSFPDGIEAEFSADFDSTKAFTHCAFFIRHFGDDLASFILKIARAGDMVIMPAMEGNPLILLSEGQKADIPVEILEVLRPIVITSAQELSAVVTGGFERWSAYRDQVLRHRAGEPSGPAN